MANREAIEKTRAALVSAPDRMFDIRDIGIDCGSPGCFIRWVCVANRSDLNSPETAAQILQIPANTVEDICFIFQGAGAEDIEAWADATRTTAIAMCDLLLEYCDGKRAIEKCTWVESHAYEKRRPLPASITSALDAREGPLVTDEPLDAELIAAMEAQP